MFQVYFIQRKTPNRTESLTLCPTQQLNFTVEMQSCIDSVSVVYVGENDYLC